MTTVNEHHSFNELPNHAGGAPDDAAFSDDVALFDAATRRIDARSESDPYGPPAPKDPNAIRDMTGPENPVRRYFDGRDARPDTLNGYRYMLRMARQLLVEAGMPDPNPEGPIEEFGWHCVTPPIAVRYAIVVYSRYACPKSAQNHLSVLRQMVKCCTQAGLMSRDEREAVLDCLTLRASYPTRAGTEITVGELQLLLRGDVRRDARGLRDSALLEVLAATGMRRCEVVDLDLRDWNPVSRTLTIRRQKGGRPRIVPVTTGAAKALRRWLKVRGKADGPLFTKFASKHKGIRLAASYANQILAERLAEVGITRRITTHDLRRTTITRLLRSGIDPFTIARFIDHKNVATTMLYDRRTEEEDAAAVLEALDESLSEDDSALEDEDR